MKSGELVKTNRRGRSAILQVVGYVNGNILPPENREVASSSQVGAEVASSSQLERQEVATKRQEIAATPTPVGRDDADEPKNQQENQKTIEPKEKNAPLARHSPPAPATPAAFLLDWQNRWRWYIEGRGFEHTPAIERMTLVRVDDRDGKLTLVFTSRHVNSEPLVMQSAGGRMARNFARDLQVDRIEFVKGELNGTGH